MGWSCSDKAYKVLEKWTEACLAQTDSQNTFKSNDRTYFWEASNKEHADGAVTGRIWEETSDGKCHPTGTFRIEGDGTIKRAPKFLKDVAKNQDVG